MGCAASSGHPVGQERRQVNGHHSTAMGSMLRTPLPLPPSQPVATPTPFHHGSPITKRDLDNLRNGFWTTRVEGNRNMWLALKSASEALLEKDVMMANAILGASNITTPNGNLTLCYDELGDVYKVPEYCCVDPIELNDRERAASSNGLFKSFLVSSASAKAVISAPMHSVDTPICVRVKVNPSDVLIQIDANLINTVEELKKCIFEKTENLRAKGPSDMAVPVSCEERRQRLIFMGKELKNGQILGDIGIDDVRVVQVFLRREEVDQTTHTVC
jgi:hypothetical protein